MMQPVLGVAAPEEVGLSTVGLDRIDAFLRTKIEDRELAGAVTMVGRHGRVVRTSIVGVDNTKNGKPLTADTIFRIFSMTKPITGLAMGILLDRELWLPDDPISKHLPEFADLTVFAGLDGRGAPILDAPVHPPTMRELATHTAGFSYGQVADSWVDGRYKKNRLLKSKSLTDFTRKLARIPLNYQPGTKWQYSVSMDVQGAIIERLTGQSLPDFLQQNIFGPLGMVDTAFFVPRAKLARRASLYYTGGKHTLRRIGWNPLYRDSTKNPRLPQGGPACSRPSAITQSSASCFWMVVNSVAFASSVRRHSHSSCPTRSRSSSSPRASPPVT